jgi:hypothetical protein
MQQAYQMDEQPLPHAYFELVEKVHSQSRDDLE